MVSEKNPTSYSILKSRKSKILQLLNDLNFKNHGIELFHKYSNTKIFIMLFLFLITFGFSSYQGNIDARHFQDLLQLDIIESQDIEIVSEKKVNLTADSTITLNNDDYITIISTEGSQKVQWKEEIILNCINPIKLQIQNNSTKVSEIPIITIINPTEISFTTDFPEVEIFKIQSNISTTIHTHTSIIPISGEFTEVSSLILYQDNTKIIGKIAASTEVSKSSAFPSKFLCIDTLIDDKRIAIHISALTGNFMLNSSWIDLKGEEYTHAQSVSYIPIQFCIGKGGSSTINFNKYTTNYKTLTTIHFVIDFDKSPTDEDLKAILSNNQYELCMINNFNIYTHKFTSYINTRGKFLHGFSDINAITLDFVSKDEVSIIYLKLSPPSKIPLYFCVTNTICDVGIKVDEFSKLFQYYTEGVENISLTIDKSIDNANFSNFNISNRDVNLDLIIGKNVKISNLNFGIEKNNKFIKFIQITGLQFNNNISFNIPQITFQDCSIDDTIEFHINFFNNKVTGGDDLILSHILERSIGSIHTFNFSSSELTDFIVQYEQVNLICNNISYFYPTELINSFELNIDKQLYLKCISYITNSHVNVIRFNHPTLTSNLKLMLSHWGKVTNPLTFYHYLLDVEITMDEYFSDPDLFIPIGEGNLKFSMNVCVCEGEKCDKICPLGFARMSYENVNPYLEKTNGTVTLFIADGSATVSLGNINGRTVNITGIGENAGLKLDSKKSEIVNFQDTKTYFQNLQLYRENGNIFRFGSLYATKCRVDKSFINSSASASVLESDFLIFGFKEFNVTNECYLDSEFQPISESKLNFQNHLDGYFTLSPHKSSFVSLDEHFIKIENKLTIKFDHLRLIPLYVIDEIYLSCNGTDFDEVMKVDLHVLPNSHIYFGGDWPNNNDPDDYLVYVPSISKSKISISSPNIPVYFKSVEEGNTFLALKENVIITSNFISNTGGDNIYFAYQDQLLNARIAITKLTLFSITNFTLRQPHLEVAITNMIPGSRKPTFFMTHYINLDGFSSISFLQQFDNDKFEFGYYLYIIMDVHLPFRDPLIQKFIKQKWPVINCLTNNLLSFSGMGVIWAEPYPTTIGFQRHYFDTIYDNDFSSIVVYVKTPIPDMEITLCQKMEGVHDVYFHCDFEFGSESDLSKYIFDKNITLNVVICNKESSPVLNFENEIFENDHIQITSFYPTHISYSYPSTAQFCHKLKSLTLNNIKLEVKGQLNVEELNLRNFSSINGNEINLSKTKHISTVFVAQKLLPLPEYHNELTLYLFSMDYHYYLHEDKYEIGSSKTYTIQFPCPVNLTIISHKVDSDIVDMNYEENFYNEESLTHVAPFKMITNSKLIKVHQNFGIITNPLDLTLTSGKDVKFLTQSLPFPFNSLYDCTIQIDSPNNTMFSIPMKINKLLNMKYYIYNPWNQPGLEFEYKVTHISEASFYGKSGMNYEYRKTEKIDPKSRVVIHNATFMSGCEASFNNVNISEELNAYGNSKVNSVTFFDSTLINLYWSLDGFPNIESSEDVTDFPKNINIIFEGESILGEEEVYQEFLYKKEFPIFQFKHPQLCQLSSEHLNFISGIDEFGAHPIFDVLCENGKLSLNGKYPLIKPNISQTDEITHYSETQLDHDFFATATLSSEFESDISPSVSENSPSSSTSSSSSSESSKTQKPTKAPTPSPTGTEIITPFPTQTMFPLPLPDQDSEEPEFVGLGITQSDHIIFTSSGLLEGNNLILTESSESLYLLKVLHQIIELSGTGRSNAEVFLSATKTDTTFVISDRPFGTAIFGIHTQYNPNLRIYSDEIPINLLATTSSKIHILNDNKMEKLTIYNINIMNSHLYIDLDASELVMDSFNIYRDSKISSSESLLGIKRSSFNKLITKDLFLHKNSKLSTDKNIVVTNSLKIKKNSLLSTLNLELQNAKLTFMISQPDSVYLNLDTTTVPKPSSSITMEQNDESIEILDIANMTLICGTLFNDCSEWIPILEKTNPDFEGECIINENGDTCLLALSKHNNNSGKKKNEPLSDILFYCIIAGVIVLVAIITILMIVILIKKKQKEREMEYMMKTDGYQEGIVELL
ncbi:hypothetical protein TRFO_19741 [Tritrichomonas foetus]|uniref:Uncharacterized protein n=1 Tax=Tritrichomonas foetus TaxID=1144522 RepID=A0A1J4KIT7_9EUKA|nr:hypothetical protein TRFO_19741 [Tritrichomonas foetus]|eukprot:OHT10848.1 hypothetical protein TRFO_19741 [Tritrichomonas foetus]